MILPYHTTALAPSDPIRTDLGKLYVSSLTLHVRWLNTFSPQANQHYGVIFRQPSLELEKSLEMKWARLGSGVWRIDVRGQHLRRGNMPL